MYRWVPGTGQKKNFGYRWVLGTGKIFTYADPCSDELCKMKSKDEFTGIYSDDLIENPFIISGVSQKLIFSTIAKNTVGTFTVDLETKELSRIGECSESVLLLDAATNKALLTCSTDFKSPSLALATFDHTGNELLSKYYAIRHHFCIFLKNSILKK